MWSLSHMEQMFQKSKISKHRDQGWTVVHCHTDPAMGEAPLTGATAVHP